MLDAVCLLKSILAVSWKTQRRYLHCFLPGQGPPAIVRHVTVALRLCSAHSLSGHMFHLVSPPHIGFHREVTLQGPPSHPKDTGLRSGNA